MQAAETAALRDPGTPRAERPEPVRAPPARALAALAIAAQAAFVASWIVAGSLEPGYSHAERYVSELAARFADHPWIVRAGFVAWGLSLAALAPGLLATLRRSRARVAAAALFVLAGVTLALAGLFPLDCPLSVDAACLASAKAGDVSGDHLAHAWLGLAAQLFLVATPFALAAAVVARPLALAALAAGVNGLVIGIAGFVLGDPQVTGPVGIVDRVEQALAHLWVLLVAGGILHATRHGESPTEPTPMPPRAFFGSSWVGEGEVVPFPTVVWRHFPLRLRCWRDITWLSDEVGYIDDRVVFTNGWTQAYRRFCHLVAPDRIHVSADDLPGGADLWLEEEGYRISPYRLLVPLGPVRLPVRCREQHRIHDGGELVDRLDMRLFGLPAARVNFRVRRVGE